MNGSGELDGLTAELIGLEEPSEDVLRRARYIAFTKRIVLVWENPRIYVYVGEDSDHVLVDSHYCSCEGFARRLLQGSRVACSHVYAVRIAENTGRIRRMVLEDPDELALIVWEVLTGGLSPTLRRKLAVE